MCKPVSPNTYLTYCWPFLYDFHSSDMVMSWTSGIHLVWKKKYRSVSHIAIQNPCLFRVGDRRMCIGCKNPFLHLNLRAPFFFPGGQIWCPAKIIVFHCKAVHTAYESRFALLPNLLILLIYLLCEHSSCQHAIVCGAQDMGSTVIRRHFCVHAAEYQNAQVFSHFCGVLEVQIYLCTAAFRVCFVCES